MRPAAGVLDAGAHDDTRSPVPETAPIDRALERGAITMRGYDRVLRVAWTLSDLGGAAEPDAAHIGRALFLRKGM